MAEAITSNGCCPPGALGFLPEGDYVPKGHVVNLPESASRKFGCRVYITGLKDVNNKNEWKNKPILMLCHDVLGQFSGRHRLLCDTFAEKLRGIVILPDLMKNRGVVDSEADARGENGKWTMTGMGFNWTTVKLVWSMIAGGMVSYMGEFPWDSDLVPCFKEQILPYLKEKGDVTKFAIGGFCWGSWVTGKFCADPELSKYATCGIHWHPSVEMVEQHFKGDDIQVAKDAKCLQYVLATPMEPKNWQPEGAAHEAYVEKLSADKVVFEATKEQHGFMTRGTTKTAMKEVEIQINKSVKWMQKYF